MMKNYEESRGKLTNTQLNKLKSTAKSKTETTLRTSKKSFLDEEFPLELFLATRKKAKIKHAFAKNMSTNLKLSKAQLSKIIRSSGFFGRTLGNVMGNLDDKALVDLAVLPAKDGLPKLATKGTICILDKFELKISGQ